MRVLVLLIALVLLSSSIKKDEGVSFEPKWKVGDVRVVKTKGSCNIDVDFPPYWLGDYRVKVVAETEGYYTVQVSCKAINRRLSILNNQLKKPIEWLPEFRVQKEGLVFSLSNHQVLKKEVERGLADIYHRYGGWMNDASSMHVLVKELENLPTDTFFLNSLNHYLPPLLFVYKTPWYNEKVGTKKLKVEDEKMLMYLDSLSIMDSYQDYIKQVDSLGVFELAIAGYRDNSKVIDSLSVKIERFSPRPITFWKFENLVGNQWDSAGMIHDLLIDLGWAQQNHLLVTYRYNAKTSWLVSGKVEYYRKQWNLNLKNEMMKEQAEFYLE